MSHIAATMPEARFRTTKKKVQPTRATSSATRAQLVMEPAAQASPAAVAAKAAAEPMVKAKAAKRTRGEAIAAWWPVGVALFLSGFVPEWHAMAVEAGIWALRFTFPLSQILAHREIGIDAQMASILPQASLYLQMPLDGLLIKLTLDRGKSLKAAAVQMLLVHAVCVFVLWLMTFSGK